MRLQERFSESGEGGRFFGIYEALVDDANNQGKSVFFVLQVGCWRPGATYCVLVLFWSVLLQVEIVEMNFKMGESERNKGIEESSFWDIGERM